MTLNLSWDLFIIVFFIVIVAYSFIIGKNQTVKVILSSYMGILTADGIVNVIQKYFLGPSPMLSIFSEGGNDQGLILLKIFIFVSMVVLLSVRGGFDISLPIDPSQSVAFLMTMTFGILSAGLIISTVLMYSSGIVFAGNAVVLPTAYQGSKLIELMITNYSIWFSLPAIVFVLSSLVTVDEEGMMDHHG